MISEFLQRIFSYVFLAAAILGARVHIAFAWALRQYLKSCGLVNRLFEWNMEKWQRGMLYNLKRFGKYQGIDVDDESDK